MGRSLHNRIRLKRSVLALLERAVGQLLLAVRSFR